MPFQQSKAYYSEKRLVLMERRMGRVRSAAAHRHGSRWPTRRVTLEYFFIDLQRATFQLRDARLHI